MGFRELYDNLTRYEEKNIYKDVLLPFLPQAKKQMEELAYLSKLKTSLPGEVNEEDLWELFALNVCNDFLLLPLKVTEKQYLSFFTSLGFKEIKPGKIFNPLCHEIVTVGNWPKREEGITIGSCYWPGLQFGEMIFSRSAVEIYCSESWGIIEGVANKSKLYFANRRINREYDDQSHGWGSNSRWRTCIGRNYLIKNMAFFNVDGEVDLFVNQGDSELNPLSLKAARELLVNRCFVQTKSQDDDFYPYVWKLATDSLGNMWPNIENCIIPFENALDKINS